MRLDHRLNSYGVSRVRSNWTETCLLERGLLVELVHAERTPALSESVVHALVRGQNMGYEWIESDRPPPPEWFIRD